MRCVARSLQSSNQNFLQLTQVPYVCSSCRHKALRQHLSHQRTIRNASSGLPLTERLRRRIWGTEDRPGLKDPYGGPSSFERRSREAQGGHQATEPAADELRDLEPEPAPPTPHERAMENESPLRSVNMHDPEQYDPDYVPAITWDGLARVGASGHWSEKRPDSESSFQPFLSTTTKATTRKQFLSSIHQAVIEVVTLKTSMLSNATDLSHVRYTPDAMASISATAIEQDDAGNHIILKYQDGGREKILESISAGLRPIRDLPASQAGAADAKVESSETKDDLGTGLEGGAQEVKAQEHSLGAEAMDERQTRMMKNTEGLSGESGRRAEDSVGHLKSKARSTHAVTSPGFLMLPLRSHELRFLIIKRLSQLTGHRIPDPLFTSSQTLMPIYNHLLRNSSPKPKKLAESLLRKQDLVSLPNLHIMPRRETPIDKDKKLGRWKIIEAELQSKGLPVLGKSRV